MDNKVPTIQEIDDANASTSVKKEDEKTIQTVSAIIQPEKIQTVPAIVKPEKKPETIANKINAMMKPKKYAKKRYYQINLMNGAGDKALISEIAKTLKDKYDVNIDSFVISIKEKQGKVIGDK